MILEVYPKPDVKNINGIIYTKENLLAKIGDFNKRLAYFISGNCMVEYGYREDLPGEYILSSSLKLTIGQISKIFFKDGVFYTNYTHLNTYVGRSFPEDSITPDKYVIAAMSSGIVNNDVCEIETIHRFVLIEREKVDPELYKLKNTEA